MTDRPTIAHQNRVDASAAQLLQQPWATLDHHGEEQRYPRAEGSFTKLLEHDDDGVLTDDGLAEYKKLVDALETANLAALNAVKLARPLPLTGQNRRVFINPQSAFSFEESGPGVGQLGMADPPSMKSREAAAELIECYGAALLRDVRFEEYGTHHDAELVAQALDAFGADWTGPRDRWGRPLLLRGTSPGDAVGGYISQFLLMPFFPLFPSGCAPFVGELIGVGELRLKHLARQQTYPVPGKREFLTTLPHFATVQNGGFPKNETYGPKDYEKEEQFLDDGRKLGGLVHTDSPYEAYYNALNILVFRGAPGSPAFPYGFDPDHSNAITNQGSGHTMGAPDAYTLMARACIAAFKAAWANKWRAFRRARPEVMAARLDVSLRGIDLNEPQDVAAWMSRSDLPVHPSLLAGASLDVLKRIWRRNERQNRDHGRGSIGNVLLPQMYPEGSPTHPAYPSGHATVAGACTTILKAFFDGSQPIPPLPDSVPDRWRGNVRVDGAGRLRPVHGGPQLTIAGELDKLASNIAHGRDYGGVHYRSDGDQGLLLGEQVALRLLQDHARTYPEAGFEGFQLTLRDGTAVVVTADGVQR